MSQNQLQMKSYWRDGFAVTAADIDFLKTTLLEHETPLSTDEMTLILMQHRVAEQPKDKPVKKKRVGKRYNPNRAIEVGESLSFENFDDVLGELVSVRDGSNPEQGEFQVGLFSFEDGVEAEFVIGLAEEVLELDIEDVEDEEEQELVQRSPEELFIEFGGVVSDKLYDALTEQDELVELAGYWFPGSLLIEVNEGHLNLAEAILDMTGGGPMSTAEIMQQVGILQEDRQQLAEFSLNHALYSDKRFDEVGPAGQIMWHLVRMEPDETVAVPERLLYTPIDYDAAVITEEFRELEVEIGDSLSRLPRVYPNQEVVTLTLTYPHLRSGTLPLTYKVRGFFPTAYEAPRIRFQLIDRDEETVMPGWVVREHGYVYGLEDWYMENEVPVGAYVEIKRLDAGVVEIGLRRYNPRVEWVPTLVIQDKSISFEDQKRRIGCEYDDLFVINIQDTEALDDYKARIEKNKLPIDKLVDRMARALIGLNQQSYVLLNTLYSAVNTVRRCPPGPIIHALEVMPQFTHFSGSYWQLKD